VNLDDPPLGPRGVVPVAPGPPAWTARRS